MLIQLLAIGAFAALFALFLLLHPADGRRGCHGCAGPGSDPACERKCPDVRDQETPERVWKGG
jgi:hypothetical protein